MWDFLRTPKWIAGHLIVVTAVTTFLAAAAWQWSRHNEVTATNAVATERLAAPPRPLAEVVDEVGVDPDLLEYRRVLVEGVYLPDEEVRVSVRQYDGRPGHHLLTPLFVLGDMRGAAGGSAAGGSAGAGDGSGSSGSAFDAVVVDRGWVPLEFDDVPAPTARPTAEAGTPVVVEGVLLTGDPDTTFGPQPPEGDTDWLGRVDLDRLQRQAPIELAPVFLLARAQDPAPPGDLPLTVPPPDLDAGPHLNYTGQWLLFAAVVLVGYPVLLGKVARERRAELLGDDADTDRPPGVDPLPEEPARTAR